MANNIKNNKKKENLINSTENPPSEANKKVIGSQENIKNPVLPEKTNPETKKTDSKNESIKYPILENSGLYAAYESLIKNICKHGLPTGDIYEYSAMHILRFEKKIKQNEMKSKMKRKELSKSMEKMGLFRKKILIRIYL